MSDGEAKLSDEVLHEICRISPTDDGYSDELVHDLRGVLELAERPQARNNGQLQYAIALLTSVLARLPKHHLTHLPFGYDGPRIQSTGWIDREDTEAAAKQIVGLLWTEASPDMVAVAISNAFSEAVRLSLVKEHDYDAWRPGMASGSGWRSAVTATPYGLSKARGMRGVQSKPLPAQRAPVSPPNPTPQPADAELTSLCDDANYCLQALGDLRRDYETMAATGRRMTGGGEDWHFDNPADEHQHRDASSGVKDAVTRLPEPLAKVLAWGASKGVDVPSERFPFDARATSGVLAEIAAEYELAVRNILGALTLEQATRAITAKVTSPQPRQAKPTRHYLYASSATPSQITPDTVFFRCEEEQVALAILNLCQKEYGSGGSAVGFYCKPASDLTLADELLLDESIDRLGMYDDPDPGVYDPPVDRQTLLRAEYARRADGWEQQLRARLSGSGSGKPATEEGGVRTVEQALERLQSTLERQRLTFLFCAWAQRRVPVGDTYKWETLERDEYPDKRIPTAAIDPSGGFLQKYSWALDRYAQAAVGQFGAGVGARASVWRDGQYVDMEGASLPVWSLDEMDCSVMEQASNALLDACRALARLDSDKRFHRLLRRVRDVAYDEGQSRWYSSVLVKWNYLARLDEAISAIKVAELDFVTEAEAPTVPQVGRAKADGATNATPHRDPRAVWMAAETIKVVAYGLMHHSLAVRSNKASPYDDRDRMKRDHDMAERHGYLVVAVARQIGLDAAALTRVLREDRLWEYPSEAGDAAVFRAAASIAEKVATEARVWCAEAGIDLSDATSPPPTDDKGSEAAGSPDDKLPVPASAGPSVAFPGVGAVPAMSPEQWQTAGVGLLLLLAQAYYKMLECVVSADCNAVNLELNHSYVWVVQNLTNLLKNHEHLADFPRQFEPCFPDLFPTTTRDVDWEDMVAPDAEGFLSAVQQYAIAKHFTQPEEKSEAWVFIELFRPGVTSAIERAMAHATQMRQHMRKLLDRAGSLAPTSASAVTPKTPANAEAAKAGYVPSPTEPTLVDTPPVEKPGVPFAIDENAFTVSMRGNTATFSGRSKLLFALMARISRRPGHRVDFDALRSNGDVWNGSSVEDETIRGAVKRLRDKLTADGLGDLANCIVTGSFQGRSHVILDLQRNSNRDSN